MFLRRSLVLAAGVLLFVVGFIVYFDLVDAKMEDKFRQERAAFGVQDGVALTTATLPVLAATTNISPLPEPAPTVSPAAPIAPASSDTPPVPSTPPNPADSSAPSPGATSDTNIIIGPVPPSAPAPPPPPPPASGPMAPPSSTMLLPGVKHLPWLMMASMLPQQGMRIQTQPASPDLGTSTPTTPALETIPPTPTNTTPAPPPAPASSTNAATTPSTPGQGGPMKPVPVEASVIVLLYHQFVPAGVHISPKFQWTLNVDVFESEMKYLHDNNYHVVSLADLVRFLKHEIGLPPNSVVITIDDGYKSAIVYAAPILKKYGYPWTFFVYPDFITVNEGAGAASWNDLLALQADGVDIESHSMTHPQLTKHRQKFHGSIHDLSPEEYDQFLTNETAGAKALLEQKLGKPVTSFAYPYGDYNKQVEAKAIAAGYESIFTVAGNPVHSTTRLTSIGRYTITQSEVKYFVSDLHQGALGLAAADPAPGSIISNPRPVITAVLGYPGNLDPKSIEAEVGNFGVVRHDFDPQTSTVRLYLPADLVQPVTQVSIRVKDAQSGQLMVARWRFSYESPAAAAAAQAHAPIGATPPATNSPVAATNAVQTPAATPTTSPIAAPSAATTNQVPIPMNSPGTR